MYAISPNLHQSQLSHLSPCHTVTTLGIGFIRRPCGDGGQRDKRDRAAAAVLWSTTAYYLQTHLVRICSVRANSTMPDPRSTPRMPCLPRCRSGGGEQQEESCCLTGQWKVGRKTEKQTTSA